MKQRCHVCKKKIPIVQYTCKCDSKLFFCAKHRLNHNCSFDYKKFYQEKLKKENPLIIPDKLESV